MAANAIEVPCVPAARRREAGALRRGITERTHRLATDAVSRVYLPYFEQAQLFAACAPPPGLSPMAANAHCFAEVYPRLTPVVREGELIVGARLRAEEGESSRWHPDGGDHYVDTFAQNAPPDRPDIRELALRGLFSPQGSFNHKVVDYAGFIRAGSLALARQAREVAATRQGDEREFALAFAQGHEAIAQHALTYARECERLAADAPPERAAELREIARICERVPAHPAETFHEAIQSLWFAYMVAGDATGRVDVYLNDFYQADLAAGEITPERAQELIECLLIKLHGDVAEGIIDVSSIQTMTLGGLLPDDSDATNDLTRLFLQAARNVRLLRPTIYVRCHDQTPGDVLDLAVTMLGEGLAEPSFYGDRPIIEGLVRLGIPLQVARDYALSGCTEVCSPGLGNWGCPNGWVNLALLADEALREFAQSGIADTDALWRTIERHVEALAEVCRVTNCWVDEREVDPRFTGTLLMPVSLKRCRDIAHGGAETHLGHWEAIGLPNAADMILAAERLLAEGENLADVYSRLDREDAALLSRVAGLAKFGNGHAEVDGIGARLIGLMCDALERKSTPLRSALTLGHLAGGENMHVAYGLVMGATLDGRRVGRPLADSLAGSQACTIAGPTATIQSVCALDHSRMVAGNISTLRLSQAEFATPEAREKVVALIRTFVAMGGSQLQINVVDAETLRQAQLHPGEHRGLIVRVAGYSADFTCLGKPVQDEMIARTEGLA